MRTWMLRLTLAVAALAAGPAALAASLTADNVLSVNVKEADGTTGQNTNAGSGIKTGHLQNGAVTDAKIAGPISASKISSAGLDADTVDGEHASSFERRYANVLVVSKDGRGDFADLAPALASIQGASPTNRYLVKIMPGTYEYAGSQTAANISLKSYVDVEGSGQGLTRLVISQSPGWGGSAPQLVQGSNVSALELRDLTLEVGSNGGAVLTFYGTMTDVRLSRVDIRCVSVGNGSVCFGIHTQSPGDLTLRDVRFTVGDPAVVAGNQRALYFNNAAPTVRMYGGGFAVATPAVQQNCFGPGTSAFLGAGVQFSGPPLEPSAIPGCGKPTVVKCVGCYSDAFDPVVVP